MSDLRFCPNCFRLLDSPECKRCSSKCPKGLIIVLCLSALCVLAVKCSAQTNIVIHNARWLHVEKSEWHQWGYQVPNMVHTNVTNGVVTTKFINWLSWQESRNNPKARGKAGERGTYQMKPIAVKDVQSRYGWKHTFQEATTTHARQYAEAYLIMCEVRFRNHYKRNPSEVELYRVWNRGFRGSFRK